MGSIFVIGSPRSGTTLVSELLKETPYGAPVETHFITKYYKRLGAYGDLTIKKNVTRLLNDILAERPIAQRRLAVDVDTFFLNLEEYTYREIVDHICLLIFEKKGKSKWGDKTPQYILDLDIIYNLFPDSKYIHLVRDGRDVALSLLEQPWEPNNIVSCASHWQKGNLHPILEIMHSRGTVFAIRYEDLLTNPLQVVGDMYGFLGADLSEEKLKQLTDPIIRDNFNKWKERMSFKDRDLFEAVARDSLEKHGYEVSINRKKLSRIELLFWEMHENFYKLIHLVKTNTVDWFLIKYCGKEPFAD